MHDYINKAEKYLADKKRIAWLIKSVEEKAEKNKAKIIDAWDDLKTLQRMLRASMNGSYKQVPWLSLLMLVAGLLYFINPLDLIPDFILTIGFIDDVTVIGMVVHSLNSDLKAFREWEQSLEKDQPSET